MSAGEHGTAQEWLMAMWLFVVEVLRFVPTFFSFLFLPLQGPNAT
jgi:hypothetical protein